MLPKTHDHPPRTCAPFVMDRARAPPSFLHCCRGTLPALARRDVLVRVAACGVCFHDWWRAGQRQTFRRGVAMPVIIGHEVAGTVCRPFGPRRFGERRAAEGPAYATTQHRLVLRAVAKFCPQGREGTMSCTRAASSLGDFCRAQKRRLSGEFRRGQARGLRPRRCRPASPSRDASVGPGGLCDRHRGFKRGARVSHGLRLGREALLVGDRAPAGGVGTTRVAGSRPGSPAAAVRRDGRTNATRRVAAKSRSRRPTRVVLRRPKAKISRPGSAE